MQNRPQVCYLLFRGKTDFSSDRFFLSCSETRYTSRLYVCKTDFKSVCMQDRPVCIYANIFSRFWGFGARAWQHFPLRMPLISALIGTLSDVITHLLGHALLLRWALSRTPGDSSSRGAETGAGHSDELWCLSIGAVGWYLSPEWSAVIIPGLWLADIITHQMVGRESSRYYCDHSACVLWGAHKD